MRRHVVDLGVLLTLASLAGGYLLLTEPGWRGTVLRAYIFVVGGLAMLALVAAAGDAIPRRRRSELTLALQETGARSPSVPELDRVQREVTLATSAAFDLHYRLLPQLREIAQARLERAGKTPGPDTLGRWWELLRPDREPPQDRFGPGIPLAELRSLVRDLERIR